MSTHYNAATQLAGLLRHFLSWPALLPLKQLVRSGQTLLNYADFQRIKQLSTSLPLATLLERQPRFRYKYLSGYLAASFSRPKRLAALLYHYDFLTATAGVAFFEQVARKLLIWQEQHGAGHFAIHLAYPAVVGFEGELSLYFSVNGILLQVVSFVIVPGQLVGAPGKPALLLSQVQGAHQPALHKHATKTLLDITPAALLMHAAYGLAQALRIDHAAGVSTEEQLSYGSGSGFNYNTFWEQFGGERTTGGFFRLAIPAPEKPLECIKSAHRVRTLRKRRYKHALRQAVEQQCRAVFRLRD
ncbi:DUF535 family protein [Hymenobacter sp. BRD128]|uniref:DUF535 family protein n=1 Tax=Hymenobacter sp. BRD128 TaxID=2675878 RepID=UPI00156527C8|nr:DUF535 family protein [Hymenobacter sp. BRD128]QKG57430.1 DUF535 family protein [Hymenobacter sp. BRD128]